MIIRLTNFRFRYSGHTLQNQCLSTSVHQFPMKNKYLNAVTTRIHALMAVQWYAIERVSFDVVSGK